LWEVAFNIEEAEMRYVLFPGFIISKYDGDSHYITARQLAELYGVDIRKCLIIYRDRPESHRGYHKSDDDIELYPDYHGNYNLPDQANKPS